MKIEVFQVKQYNSTYKQILVIDGTPVACADSKNRIAQFVAYVNGSNEVKIEDGKIKSILDKYRVKEGK